MASIQFYANIKDTNENTLISGGSGLGFFGAGYGISVPIDSQQSSTFVTSSDGTVEGTQLNNTAMSTIGDESTAGTTSINSLTAINNDKLPNYLCPLNVRFTNDEAVRVQNCKLRIFDRNNIANNASGVTTYVYEARHPSTVQTISNLSHRGRDANSWVTFTDGISMADMTFTSSPGLSGLNTSIADTDTNLGYTSQEGTSHASTQHDWYVAISSEPDEIGEKTQYGLYFSVEYL